MAAVPLFWDTNMAAVTSCENTLYFYTTNEDYKMRGHFLQKNTIKKHEMTGKTGGWSSPFFSFFGNRWVFGLFKVSLYILTNVAVLKQANI